ncbi:uncharacterized protein JCM10292_003888 [Rhodotorula paludigena]|uniref:uncharacterized protein n=1 Tax=Rhodotorula paludigena TaxID=86838 RepID=UPI00317E05E5
MADAAEHPAPGDDADPPPLPDYPVPAVLVQQPPPSKSILFDLYSTTPVAPPPPKDDPRVSLRNADPLPPPYSGIPPAAATAADFGDEPSTLSEFRESEGDARRLTRLRSLFESIPAPSPPTSPVASTSALPAEEPTEEQRCAQDRRAYTRELWRKCGAAVAASVAPVVSPASPAAQSAGTSSTTGSPETERQRQAALAAVRWKAFEQYAEEKERELWRAFCDLDRDGDMRLKRNEVREACKRAGIDVQERAIDEFIRAVDRNGDGAISFDEWRDFLLLLPRQTSMKEIWRYWQARRLHRPSMSRLTQDGDVVIGGGKSGWNKLLGRPSSGGAGSSGSSAFALASKEEREAAQRILDATDLHKLEPVNAEQRYVGECERVRRARRDAATNNKGKGKAKAAAEAVARASASSNALEFEESGVVVADPSTDNLPPKPSKATPAEPAASNSDALVEQEEEEDEHEPLHDMFAGAGKFLLAGGMAGAVSRTATAPFDRLKVYLITSPASGPIASETAPDVNGKRPRPGAGSLVKAVRAVYTQGGGIKAFWTGNGLNIVKIFPESAIKFLSYESAKRIFAQYWDHVPDQTMISNSSRFVAGGIGGVISQFCIYPIESLKTRVMSSSGGSKKGNALIVQTARDMWAKGGLRFFFRGLPAGLIGVFPYSAIDMSTFEGIKLAYTKWAGEEPGIFGSLCFGAFSGGVGASSVYPLNLVRTRLQAQGTPAHPQTYTGVRDAALKCYQREGWRGFYKGLTPTLVKVVPAVAISYAVYDTSKKMLFPPDDHATLHQDNDSDES